MAEKSPRLVALAAVVMTACSAAAAEPADPPPPRKSPVEALRRVEAFEMLAAILSGQDMDGDAGWFHPAQSAYGWKWLSERMDANRDGAVTADEFAGPKELFEALDRDRDGRLTAADFDWSDASPYWRQMSMARMLLRRGDADGDGKLTAEEWEALFKQAAKGKDKLSADDLRALLFPPPKPPSPPTMAPKMTLLAGLFKGEIGSVTEGPAVGRPAPDFTLRTADGKELSLHDYRADRPLVLVFGSFT